MQIAVVIPALDEQDWIEGSVRSAREPGVEVVVADGGSRDETAKRAHHAGARVVPAAPGRARQLEAGRRAAEADVFVFLHADTRLPPGFARAVREVLAHPGVAGGAFTFRFDRSTPLLRLVEWGVRVRVAVMRLPYGDQALFARRPVLEAIGGIPQVPIMEDLDLVQAIKRHGRFALLRLPAITSARRYLARGVARTMMRNAVAAAAWVLGIDRARVASWYGQ